ncbi:unnamed protein product, partial [Porites lobata]
MVRLVMKDETESKTAPINNGYLNGDKKKTHYRIGDEAARSEMRSLQFSLHGRNPNAEIVSSIQLARRIRGRLQSPCSTIDGISAWLSEKPVAQSHDLWRGYHKLYAFS